MSTSVSSRGTAAPLYPTRQQLDDLDALLQRMLDLPVNQVEELDQQAEPPFSYQTAESEPSVAQLEPRVVPMQDPPPIASQLDPTAAETVPGADDWVRLASTWTPSAQTWQPLAESWQQLRPVVNRPVEPTAPPSLPPTQPAPAVENVALEDAIVPPLPLSEGPSLENSASVRERGPRYAVWQWPFLVLNVVFDVFTWPLGPLGAGLRSRVGRNLLAAIGVLCLLAAGAILAADYQGWTW